MQNIPCNIETIKTKGGFNKNLQCLTNYLRLYEAEAKIQSLSTTFVETCDIDSIDLNISIDLCARTTMQL